MGWKSTIRLTREDAVKTLKSLMWNLYNKIDDENQDCTCDKHDTNELITDLIEWLRGGDKHGHNYQIVHEDLIEKSDREIEEEIMEMRMKIRDLEEKRKRV